MKYFYLLFAVLLITILSKDSYSQTVFTAFKSSRYNIKPYHSIRANLNSIDTSGIGYFNNLDSVIQNSSYDVAKEYIQKNYLYDINQVVNDEISFKKQRSKLTQKVLSSKKPKKDNIFIDLNIPSGTFKLIRSKYLTTPELASKQDRYILRLMKSLNKDNSLTSSVDTLSKFKDSAQSIYYSIRQDLEMSRHFIAMKSPIRWFPVRSGITGKQHYGDTSSGAQSISFVKTNTILTGTDRMSFYSEFISGFAGMFRVSIGSLIASENLEKLPNDSISSYAARGVDFLSKKLDSINNLNKEKGSIQRLLGGGGNIVLGISTPFFEGDSRRTIFRSVLFAKASGDFSAFGNSTEGNLSKIAGSVSGGATFALDFSILPQDKKENDYILKLSGTATYNQGTTVFNRNLNMENSKLKGSGFFVFQMAAGLQFSKKVGIFLNWAAGTGRVKQQFKNSSQGTVGFSITP